MDAVLHDKPPSVEPEINETVENPINAIAAKVSQLSRITSESPTPPTNPEKLTYAQMAARTEKFARLVSGENGKDLEQAGGIERIEDLDILAHLISTSPRYDYGIPSDAITIAQDIIVRTGARDVSINWFDLITEWNCYIRYPEDESPLHSGVFKLQWKDVILLCAPQNVSRNSTQMNEFFAYDDNTTVFRTGWHSMIQPARIELDGHGKNKVIQKGIVSRNPPAVFNLRGLKVNIDPETGKIGYYVDTSELTSELREKDGKLQGQRKLLEDLERVNQEIQKASAKINELAALIKKNNEEKIKFNKMPLENPTDPTIKQAVISFLDSIRRVSVPKNLDSNSVLFKVLFSIGKLDSRTKIVCGNAPAQLQTIINKLQESIAKNATELKRLQESSWLAKIFGPDPQVLRTEISFFRELIAILQKLSQKINEQLVKFEKQNTQYQQERTNLNGKKTSLENEKKNIQAATLSEADLQQLATEIASLQADIASSERYRTKTPL